MIINVPSAADPSTLYGVEVTASGATCPCKDFIINRKGGKLGPCKHIRGVLAAAEVVLATKGGE